MMPKTCYIRKMYPLYAPGRLPLPVSRLWFSSTFGCACLAFPAAAGTRKTQSVFNRPEPFRHVFSLAAYLVNARIE
jgi:hypothetical protein